MSYYGEDFPKLGFGLMRLPTVDGKENEVDIEQVKKMVDLFFSRGFNYFDTAYLYHGGQSEVAFREAVVKRYPRESFHIVDKMPMWNINGLADYERIFNEQLERTGLEYFDLYYLHGIGADRLEMIDRTGGWDFLKSLKERGLAKHIGFSYHSPADPLDKILDAHPEVEVVQLQINYYDWDTETVQARRCYEVARKHGVGIVIMEPVRGGALAVMQPEMEKKFKDYAPDASLASWALRWAASLEGLTTVLSGMSDLAQVEDNTKTMMDFKPLTDEERKIVNEVVEDYKKVPTIPCTSCKYCVNSCPMNINTPAIISLINEYERFPNLAPVKRRYGMTAGRGGKASDCVYCRSCEDHCPQNLPITDILARAANLFE